MPSVKCGACAKFLSSTEAAKCNKCSLSYHRPCVLAPHATYVVSTWRCPECTGHVAKASKADSLVKGKAAVVQKDSTNPDDLMETSQISCISPGDAHASTSIFTELTNEMRLFREEMGSEIRELRLEFQFFRSEMTDVKVALQSYNDRMNNMETRLDALQARLDQQDRSYPGPTEAIVTELKSQLNERDQELLMNDVEISGITETRDESSHIIKVVCSKLGVTVDDREIVHIQRVGLVRRNRVSSGETASSSSADQRPRNICVRFARRSTRDELLRAARVRRGLSTGDLQMGGATRMVYVNERLTKSNRNLFYNARQAGALHGWRYVWTKDGRILARHADGQKVHSIKCEEDVKKIFGQI